LPDRSRLQTLLERIDRRSYPAYRDLKGRWQIGTITVQFDHIQGDPFAAPSRLRAWVPTQIASSITEQRDSREAAEDWLLRRFVKAIRTSSRGSGKSGQIRAYRPGPEITERSALRLHPDGTAEVRLQAGLPASGRRILGRQALEMLTQDLPRFLEAVTVAPDLDAHVESVCTQRALRRQLEGRGLVAFIANGSVLPRLSGIDSSPLPNAVPFVSPPSLEVHLDTPEGPVGGMGIPEGVTLIVGGGFHGKSTLLQAIQHGHLDHIPGDGRERVVCHRNAVKIRAEDGRSVTAVDISPFLNDLPGGKTTRPFSTADASGSTSQAAAIVEAVESGARVLLMDEDTSATNLLVRDERMRQLIPREQEPITPLVERIQQLKSAWNVSTVMVVGGVGDYLAIADVVIAMNNYVPTDVSTQARGLAPDVPPPPGPLDSIPARVPLRAGLKPEKIRARNERRIGYGGGEIELSAVEQILDVAHAASIGETLRLIHEEFADGRRSLKHILDALDAILDDEGVEALSPRSYPSGELIRPRRHEIAAALSRVRTLRIAQ